MTDARVAICTVAATELNVASTYSGQTGTSPAGPVSRPESMNAITMSPIVELQPIRALTMRTRLRSKASAIMPPQSPATIIGSRPMPPTSDTANVDSVMS